MFMNTLIVAIVTCILATFFLISIAYTMSRMRFKMRKPYLNIALILGMFPGFMSMIAVYYILKGMGLTDGGLKLIALILVYSGGANLLSFYVAKGFFDTIPKGIDEAAYIDGATRWNVFTKITLPLSRPILVYTLLTSFIAPVDRLHICKGDHRIDSRYYTVSVGFVPDACKGKYLSVVYVFCGRSGVCVHTDRDSVYLRTEILCGRTIRRSKRVM